MSVDYTVGLIYDEQIKDITTTQEKWKSVLRLAGKIYRFEFDNILMVYAQRPNARLVADYDTWKKVGRYVRRGSKGIAIFPSQALPKPYMRYVFDIGDTGGKNVKLTWDMDEKTAMDYLEHLARNGEVSLDTEFDITDNTAVLDKIKDFTKESIGVIMDEDFHERLSELTQLSGSVIREFSEKRNGSQQMEDMEAFVKKCVLYVVGTRCGFDLSVQEQDFGQIVNFHDEEIVYRLGSIVCDVSCSVLRDINRNLKTIESERRAAYGRNGTELRREGRSVLPGNQNAGADSRQREDWKVRQDGNELPQGERAGAVSDTSAVREVGREDEGSGRGSEQPSGQDNGELSNEAQAEGSVIHDGDVEAEGTGKGNLFVSMPHYKSNERDENNAVVYKDICNPITKEFRQELYDNILETYEKVVSHTDDRSQGEAVEEKDIEMPEFSVKVTPFERENSNIRGLARIYFDDSFVVGNVNILQGKENLFISMPSFKTKKKDEQGKAVYQDICYPVTKEFREKLYGELMDSYEKEKTKQEEQSRENAEREGEKKDAPDRERENTPFR